jgi:hypothetical protein
MRSALRQLAICNTVASEATKPQILGGRYDKAFRNEPQFANYGGLL